MSIAEEYRRFIDNRTQLAHNHGFEPIWFPDRIKAHQRYLADWAIRKGRSAVFAQTGLGKTIVELTWAKNVVMHTGKSVLIFTPLAVAPQIVSEGEKFGIECHRSHRGERDFGVGIYVTNYDRIHLFNPDDFAGAACDESGSIKDNESQRSVKVVEFMRTIPYRLLATATPSPNDYMELGTSSEALGELGHMDMLAQFFKSDDCSLHPFRTFAGGKPKTGAKWQFRPHAEKHFWRWVCSWAKACRKPSDFGFDDEDYNLPPLETRRHVVAVSKLKPGFMFEMPARGLREQRDEQRRSLDDRCRKAAELVDERDDCSIVWCGMNAEGDLLEKLIPGSVQVSGKDSEEYREEIIDWFIGNRCICQLKPKHFRDKLASCGNQNTPKTGEKSTNPISPNGTSESPSPGLPKKIESTCEPITSQTSQSSSVLPNSKPPTINGVVKNTPTTQNTEKNSKPNQEEGAKQRNERPLSGLDSESQSMITSECCPTKTEDVQSALAHLQTKEGEDSTSIIVTQPERSEDSFAPTATKDSESSKTIQNHWVEQSCTCGHISGKRVLISKPILFGYGLNLQCCSHMVYFVSNSFEQMYQAIRRCYRFGQKKSVVVDLVTTQGGFEIMANLERKAAQAERQYEQLVKLMNDGLRIERKSYGTKPVEVPEWL